MTKIEQTRRAMYDMLEAMRRAKKHPTMLRAFEEALEEHLEAIKTVSDDHKRTADALARNNLAGDEAYGKLRKEYDDCQERMRAVDEAYRKSQEALVIAGDELRRVQVVAKDCLDAEKLADDLSDKLRDAQSVIGQQEQLIAGQRKAIADMHNELAHRRVVCRAFEQARDAFVALDIALHDAPQSKAMRSIDRYVVDAEVKS